MIGGEVGAALHLVQAGVDALLAANLSRVSGDEVVALLSGLEVQRRRLQALDHAVVAEAGVRGTAGEYGRTSTADLLVTALRVTPAEAKRRVAQAVDLGPRQAGDR
jgi:Domain of unknown function (DUF222)